MYPMYPPPTNHQNYGVPLYAVDWVPARRKSQPREDPDDDDDQKEAQPPTKTKTKTPTELAQFDPKKNHVVLAGGGGEGSSGVPNAILVAQFDTATASLSDHPVARLDLGSDLPYRMAVHPGGDGLICSFPNSCRWFEWEEESSEVPKLGLRQSAKVLNHLLGAGQQLALAFNREGSMLAAGGEDGKLRVFKWPSLEIIINEAKAHSEVKQLDFSPDGKFLISLGSGGPGKVWDVNASSVVAPLPAEKGEIFCACRFSLISDGNYILNIADKSGGVITWNTSTWNRITSKTIATSIISFGISADGKLLACGTAEGDLLIVNSTRMRMQKVVKKAHLGFVTALSFSHDPRVFASISMDSSVRVTTVEEEKTNGELSSWIIILVILIAIVAYILKNPEKSLSFNSS